MRIFILICLAILAPLSAAGAPKVVYVRCGKLIFDAEKPPIANAGVVITDGKVTAVGADVTAPAGAETDRSFQYTVMPGPDRRAHAHLERLIRIDAVLRAGAAPRHKGGELCPQLRHRGHARSRHQRISLTSRCTRRSTRAQSPGLIWFRRRTRISIIGGHGDFISQPVQFPLTDYYTPLQWIHQFARQMPRKPFTCKSNMARR